jgi:hypothetical protein
MRNRIEDQDVVCQQRQREHSNQGEVQVHYRAQSNNLFEVIETQVVQGQHEHSTREHYDAYQREREQYGRNAIPAILQQAKHTNFQHQSSENQR